MENEPCSPLHSPFAEQAATVIIREASARGQDTVKAIEQKGWTALFVESGVGGVADVEQLVGTIMQRFGRIDCAFNNAGELPRTNPLADTENLTTAWKSAT
jgi:NAD(P)-dependent dehydrogenase (short-subunit alcohol dehydrogenase family)